jgi:tetrahydromethanopterin S-methyltransferase subunit D
VIPNLINPGPSWKLRRRAVFGSLIFGMFIILYVALRWDSTSLAETLALGSFGLIGAVVAAYIGGAVYEDVRLPQYKKQLSPSETTKEKEEYYDEEEE